jgi:hypothetical protein
MEALLMTTNPLFARDSQAVKSELQTAFCTAIDDLFGLAESGAKPRAIEIELWKQMLQLGRLLMAVMLAMLCRRATERDLQRRGLSQAQVTLRMDEDYWATQTTTFGAVRFPTFAYRDRSMGVVVTRTPARKEVLPLQSRCRSSELCLEWESRLGSEFPFRRAQQALSFFTHDAVSLEDTTIASHMVAIGGMIDRTWLYRPVAEIREILEKRATRDLKSDQPILYFSSDAHALRRYVDESWDASWKMANGIRLWCVDGTTGAVIHMGGEYTWGDCRVVRAIIDHLIESGILPRDGDYGNGVTSDLVAVTDGMEWLEEHLLSPLPWAQRILDMYHVLEHVAEFAAACFGKATKKARKWYDDAARLLLGKKRRKPARKPRRGHRKNRKRQIPKRRAAVAANSPDFHAGKALLNMMLAQHEDLNTDKQFAAFDSLIGYLDHNCYRMDYHQYRSRGLQIGSGAMESLHRIASQVRLKIPGGRWLHSTAEAIFNLRMLALVDRWEEFWDQSDLSEMLVEAFERRAGEAS